MIGQRRDLGRLPVSVILLYISQKSCGLEWQLVM